MPMHTYTRTHTQMNKNNSLSPMLWYIPIILVDAFHLRGQFSSRQTSVVVTFFYWALSCWTSFMTDSSNTGSITNYSNTPEDIFKQQTCTSANTQKAYYTDRPNIDNVIKCFYGTGLDFWKITFQQLDFPSSLGQCFRNEQLYKQTKLRQSMKYHGMVCLGLFLHIS